jgi:hypothetical protein
VNVVTTQRHIGPVTTKQFNKKNLHVLRRKQYKEIKCWGCAIEAGISTGKNMTYFTLAFKVYEFDCQGLFE